MSIDPRLEHVIRTSGDLISAELENEPGDKGFNNTFHNNLVHIYSLYIKQEMGRDDNVA